MFKQRLVENYLYKDHMAISQQILSATEHWIIGVRNWDYSEGDSRGIVSTVFSVISGTSFLGSLLPHLQKEKVWGGLKRTGTSHPPVAVFAKTQKCSAEGIRARCLLQQGLYYLKNSN